jgi:hypothetical protein
MVRFILGDRGMHFALVINPSLEHEGRANLGFLSVPPKVQYCIGVLAEQFGWLQDFGIVG